MLEDSLCHTLRPIIKEVCSKIYFYHLYLRLPVFEGLHQHGSASFKQKPGAVRSQNSCREGTCFPPGVYLNLGGCFMEEGLEEVAAAGGPALGRPALSTG